MGEAQGPPAVKKSPPNRFIPRGRAAAEGPAQFFSFSTPDKIAAKGDNPSTRPPPAETGFDDLTNGFFEQGPPFEEINEDNVEPLRSYNDGRFIFEEAETVEEGLGPTYNTQSCSACHQNIVTGAASQIAEHRTGHTFNGQFFESPGGSLIHSRATFPDIVEHVLPVDTVRTFRISTNIMGDGYVECVSDSTLTVIRDALTPDQQGTAPEVAVLEGDGSPGVGRFGWKCQHRSLLSFASDAYLNEMGITNPLFPDENTSQGLFVGYGTAYDPLPEPEDDGTDTQAFVNFMRSTKAPPRGPITPDVHFGEKKFNIIGCNVCHVASITTAAAGTPINGGAFTVPDALGNRVIHPYSDFLLHDIGTGDGIPIQPTPQYAGTATQIRTAPLWGLRTRNRLMHDGLSFTYDDAIQRHDGQAAAARDAFNALGDFQKAQVIDFLNSL
ncbi:MAG: hypothetical protein DME59_02010 [Verrucomicrobia bacterium]|nr:MAG: hypothetical protein DME59_02010 [Verrucomicrobiota bacterium]